MEAEQGAWATLCAAAETPKQRAMLEDFEFDRMEGGRLRLRKRADASPSAGWTMQKPQGLADLASSAFGRRIEIEFVENAAPTKQASDEVAADVNDHPLVQEAMDLFGAHVVQVRRTEQPVKEGDSATTPENQG
ncbi:MAG: hypothetical protein CBB69_000570 [Phycisphaera sp. TMED9]|nr:MAG: hypothetical protein CBB69_000570 [Phycisphaera sp. TMED9]